MSKAPRIKLELDGLGEITELIEKASEQLNELRETLEKINVAQMTLQVKINQPTAGTDG